MDSTLYENPLRLFRRDERFLRDDLGEDMEVIKTSICGYWKPRILLNHRTRRAYQFMDANECLIGVTDRDIEWATLASLPPKCIGRAKIRDAHYPTSIGRFENGVSMVCWQLNPDGRYHMDEDGYGMTDDEEVTIYGFIDTSCRVVVPYQAITSFDDLKTLRTEAEQIAKES